VRVSVVLAAVSVTYDAALASGWAMEKKETMSVVSAPSAVAATMLSPSLRASRRARVPSAMVTIDDEGKHGSSDEPDASAERVARATAWVEG
jgi:hypothetical protein